MNLLQLDPGFYVIEYSYLCNGIEPKQYALIEVLQVENKVLWRYDGCGNLNVKEPEFIVSNVFSLTSPSCGGGGCDAADRVCQDIENICGGSE